MIRFLHRFGIPFLIVAVISGAGAWLSRQDKAKQMPTLETVAPVPVPAPGPPPLPPGTVMRSLDKLNALAKAVGCPTLEPGDPAVRIFDTAECLGEKATNAKLPAGQTGGRTK